jgi:hypothetical protein
LQNNGVTALTIASTGAATFSSSDASGWFGGFSNSGTNFAYMGATAQFANSGGTSTDFGIRSANALAFYTSGGTERMRITSGGYLKASNNGSYQSSTGSQHEFNQSIGDNWLVFFQNTATSPAPYGLRVRFRDINGTGNQFLYLDDAGGLKLQVLGNGNVQNANNSYGAISDINLKENIVDASNKLDDLLKVKIRNYNLIADETKTKQIGVVAQELETIFPNMVETFLDADTKEEFKSVKYSVFVPMLIKAIQEQQSQIEELKELIKNK